MGNQVSRCAHSMRKLWRPCAGKRPEDEAMLNTCDSEPLDKPLCDTSVSGGCRDSRSRSCSRDGSHASLVRLHDKMERVDCRITSATNVSSGTTTSTPKCGRFRFCSSGNNKNHHQNHHVNPGYRSLTSCCDADDYEDEGNGGGDCGTTRSASSAAGKRRVDRESQTSFAAGTCASDGDVSRSTAAREPCVLSKEYIVKTYSIQNATPSPASQSKFPSSGHTTTSQQQEKRSETSQSETQGSSSGNSPLATLERRQEDVLKRLEQLRSSVSKLKQQYNVQDEPPKTATTVAATTTTPLGASSTVASPLEQGQVMLDLVISADPSSVPLSLLVLCGQLCERYAVLKATYVHSSVSDSVPDNLRGLLSSNGGLKRSDAQVAITLVWKKVVNGPQLMVDPTKQTTIMGEVNIARYITRLLQPAVDSEDVVKATQVDELLDLAQLQLVSGNAKEKAAAVRTLNANLGKQDWLTGASPSLADIVLWSVLQQTGQASSPPANVKKWLALCQKHSLFQSAVAFVS
ncbi:aminoacyl tRNA synthase complex-interacting multifunctional protein 2 [Aplysia californica]|uniref:Aminoacyl tRNA synthase complex-interacting multifunctional protein 2 n=1 Tax=Aplysia californica TaxID=6500 RepID=A0ABM0JKH9_APLCA|nr:aminoacyl tRNA synthase complex-interacting multifunctional protein 2 [Aplysia californica]XP_005095846.1 aminoacyl tRNA synthase complex-interacting multifunctional protein 2 [Aplysia californica]XP_012936525.1 aminoacyl tRNA synthase complex-interacting multifunctional protein 2 [Aplysia californica]